MTTRAFAPWFDAHLDLAYLSECGRDMDAPAASSGGPHPPAAVTWPALREGGVRFCLGTIFTEPDGQDAVGYPAGDAKAAGARGRAQLARYERWAATQRVALMPRRGERAGSDAPICLGILMENADPIERPEELEWWVSCGVVAVGPAWAKQSRYAGGNSTATGLTDIGRALIREMDRLGVVIDLSHLSDAACDEVLAMTPSPVMASHSNCRALLGGSNQRHLRDETIVEIARRGGVIGLNLYGKFLLANSLGGTAGARSTIDDAIAHVERVCELVGHRRATGLGSDMDGGFSAAELPSGIDAPASLSKLLDALASRGWSDADIRGFACDNWLRYWGW